MQQQFSGEGSQKDFTSLFKSAKESLEIIDHKFDLQNADDRLLKNLKLKK
jgi:hypothetical protein